MIKSLTALEVKIGERVYKFLCDVESPLGEAHDAISQMKNYVVGKINEAHAASQSQAPIEPEVEVLPPEA